MKNKLLIIALVAIIGFSFAACGDGSDGDGSGGGGGPTSPPVPSNLFTSIADMKTWLDAAPANTKATAYQVKLNVGNLIGDYNTTGSAGKALSDNSTKYVSLDLSGSTFTSIEQGAFATCISLTSVTIPSTVTSIGIGAFIACASLTSVTIPSTVTSIGNGAFATCTSLTSVTFATGSNIADANFGTGVFPEGNNGLGGDTLKNAYNTGKAGTYTRAANGSTWTKQ